MTEKKEVRNLLDFAESPSPIKSRFRKIARQNQGSDSNNLYDNDDYLADLLKVLKVRSTIVGIGGAGNNTVSRLTEMGKLKGANTLNVNTDAHDLYYSNANKKVLIGKEKCSGLGSGNNPKIGAEAAEEDSIRLNQLLNTDLVFLTCGLGGGTGTGAAPIIAREAKKNNATVVSFCSIPFKSEGVERRTRARIGLKKLAKYSDTLIPIPNDNLLKFLPNAPLLTCFKIMDEVLVKSIREIVNLINNCGLINIDYADIKRVFSKSPSQKYPSGLMGITESLGKDADLIKKSKLALHNPLLNLDVNKIENCVVSVTGNHNLSLNKVNKIVSTITNDIPPEAHLKFGTKLDPDLGSVIKIMVLGKGPVSPYVIHAVNEKDEVPVA